MVSVGDVLAFPQGRSVRVVRIEAIGLRRSRAVDARRLYADLSPAPESREKPPCRNERREAIEAKRRTLE
jgi:ribosome-associated heat shock protein Hsp15